ncbi:MULTISPECIES: flagellar motor protein MotB [Euryhalocaulis]|uniref:flagellar motor protein MotB n=1 Tax=Euryhalocaulis TaxID=1712422 RepID=UPI00039C85C9|nr:MULTISPECIES: flagellar motor protein MotB [Euryhalocaulis]MBA4802712.1 OmpA family protein [Euryhalocaulis sp.]
MAGDQAIIIKKVKKGGGHGHHGGAWKVAYADFVTAMMAFFLLMWLINTTTPEQKRGIADYFAPASVSPSQSGSGGVLGGTSIGEDGAKGSGASSVIEQLAPKARQRTNEEQRQAGVGDNQGADAPEVSQSAEDRARAIREAAAFESAEMSLRQAMQDMPELAELSKHLIIDETPEGLRIQIVDQEGRPMFEPGSAEPHERARTLLRAVGEIAARLPNRVSVSGHTDSSVSPNPAYTNWELSSDRANASRRMLQSAGLPGDRVYQVTGKAGSEPLFPDDPYQAGNRRISITLLREAPVLPPGYQP